MVMTAKPLFMPQSVVIDWDLFTTKVERKRTYFYAATLIKEEN
jgi:hypothetical protein